MMGVTEKKQKSKQQGAPGCKDVFLYRMQSPASHLNGVHGLLLVLSHMLKLPNYIPTDNKT
jgi:hypothetical protein